MSKFGNGNMLELKFLSNARTEKSTKIQSLEGSKNTAKMCSEICPLLYFEYNVQISKFYIYMLYY